MDLSIITINYNTPKLLKDLLSSLDDIRQAEKELDFEVIVVNVTPEDGSEAMINGEFSWVKHVVDTRNLGFSGNNNIGIKEATGRYVLFLNSDTTVPEGTLSEMVVFMDANKDVGAATCYVELASGGMDPDCHRGFPTPWASLTYFLGLEKMFPQSRLLGQYHQFYKNLAKTHEIDSCAGAFLLMPREVGEKIDLRKTPAGKARPLWWDEDFFFYGEDLDLCWRVKESGYKIMFYPHVKIIHHKGGSSGIREESKDVTTGSQETKMRILPETTRAMRLFYQKHLEEKYPWVVNKLVYLGITTLEKLRLSKT